jgi:mannose-6-phosphate isomerase-like protein (cupin superfamily)
MLSFLRSAQPARTNNTANNPIKYDSGRSSVTFAKPNSDYIMTHRIPPSTKEHGVSIVAPPFHYHIHQDEFFRLQSGKGNFYRGIGKEPFAVLSDEAGGQRTASIKAGRYHRFENASKTEDLVVDIHLSPEFYEAEQRFFRNFFGYLDDCREAGRAPSFFHWPYPCLGSGWGRLPADCFSGERLIGDASSWAIRRHIPSTMKRLNPDRYLIRIIEQWTASPKSQPAI